MDIKKEIITIPGLPHGSYNGTLIPISSGFRLIFRSDKTTLSVALLDSKYRVIPDSIAALPLKGHIDARYVKYKGVDFMSTSSVGAGSGRREKIVCSTILDLENDFEVGPCKFAFAVGEKARQEKNWIPFVVQNKMYYIYKINPHIVLSFDFTSDVSPKISNHQISGEFFPCDFLRGTTNPVLIDGNYLSTYHYATSEGYFTGFYQFESHSPFKPISFTKPLILPSDVTGYNSRENDPRPCIFLCSMQIEGDLVRLCGGNNDHSVIVMHMSLQQILDSLNPVSLVL